MNKISLTTLAAFFASIMFVNSSNAAEVNLGQFSGTLTTNVSQGFQVRTSATACELNSGAAKSLTDAQLALIGGYSNTGNGGCDKKQVSSLGTSSKVVGIGSVNSDDGRNNFKKGDFTSISTSVSLSFSGSSDSGVGVNFSGSALKDSALDVNAPAFKAFSTDAQDHFETNLKVGNAYVTLPIGDADITIGRFVQSQGVTALMPIGVNVVNPVSLPIIRAPGTLLKDALLPQAMVGFNSYLGDGVSIEGYYQLEQSEFELDAAGSFFGSDILGEGNGNVGLLSSARPMENGEPYTGVYHDIQACTNGVAFNLTNIANGTIFCSSSDTWTAGSDGGSAVFGYFDKMSTDRGVFLTDADNLTGTLLEETADNSVPAGGSNTSMAQGYHAFLLAGASGAVQAGGKYDATTGAVLAGTVFGSTSASSGIVPASSSITDAEFLSAHQTLAAHGDTYGAGTIRGSVDVKRAPDALAKTDGQFGLNLSGYADDIGTGIEWGLYYNNSHSNAPRVRVLGIKNLYSTHLYGQLLQNTTDPLNQGNGVHFDLEDDSSGSGATQFVNETIRDLETGVGTITFSPTLCQALTGLPEGSFASATHIHDPSRCMLGVRGYDANTNTIGDSNLGSFVGGAVGALATLTPTLGGRYQAYYPEDIQTFGASLSTNVGPTTMNVEVAYRPDYPFQIDVSDLLNNLIDSTGGSLVQSFTTLPVTARAGTTTTNALAAIINDQRWSMAPLCDLSSSGNASMEMAGYNYCDGTAEFDAWTFNVNFIRSLAPSHPAVEAFGADSGFVLFDVGAVSVPHLDYKQGVVAANHFNTGFDINQNGCKNTGGSSTFLTPQANSLFGTNYCSDGNMGADEFSAQYKLRSSMTYNNVNNSQWSMTPSLGLDHGFLGNAPSSLGGWTEKSMQLNLGLGFANQNGMSVAINYTDRMGAAKANKSNDKDTLSASMSYAF